MAVVYRDKYVLSQDADFRNRIRAALLANALTIVAEANNVGLHAQRLGLALKIINLPDTYAQLFANTIATDVSVIGDATQAGTVALTSGNSAAQGALATDAHIDGALAAQFNAFFSPI